MQGAVIEILRRNEKILFHEKLIHSNLIYDGFYSGEMKQKLHLSVIL